MFSSILYFLFIVKYYRGFFCKFFSTLISFVCNDDDDMVMMIIIIVLNVITWSCEGAEDVHTPHIKDGVKV